MRKIQKISWPTDREFAQNLNPFPKVLFNLGVFSYHNKRLSAGEFEATIKPNYWNPLFYVAYTFIFLLLFVANMLRCIVITFGDTTDTFTKSKATLDFDEKYVIESEEC